MQSRKKNVFLAWVNGNRTVGRIKELTRSVYPNPFSTQTNPFVWRQPAREPPEDSGGWGDWLLISNGLPLVGLGKAQELDWIEKNKVSLTQIIWTWKVGERRERKATAVAERQRKATGSKPTWKPPHANRGVVIVRRTESKWWFRFYFEYLLKVILSS